MKLALNVLICLLLLNSSISLSAPKQNLPPLEKVSLQLKWLHHFQFAGYYAAKEKGFYAAEGLDVDIRERIPHVNNIEQVLKGEAEYGIADSSLLLDRLKGKPVVVLASIFQHNALVYISLKSSGIVSPYEFKGKRIMDEDDVIAYANAPLQAMRYETGISTQDFTRIDYSYNPDDLINGKTDVMTGYLTDVLEYYREKNVEINIIDPRNYGIDFLGDNLFTTEQQIRNHPEKTQRFVRASLKGWDYALKHSEEIIQLILRQYDSRQRLSATRLRSEAAETAKMILPDSIPLGSSSIKRFQRMAEVYQQLGLVKSLDGLEGFIYQPAVTTNLKLTLEEKNWLQTHPVIHLAIDKDFAPYEWIDSKGNYVGLTADYIHKVEQALCVKFDIVKDKPWAETLAMAKRGEVEVVSDANQTPEREQYLNFSEPHVSIPVIIVNQEKNGFIGSLHRLNGKKVVVEKSYFMQERLSNEHPEIQLVTAKNTDDALAMVNNGEVDAYVGDAASVNYVIRKTGMINLKFSGDTGYKSEHRMAATKTNPILISLLTKALDSIPNAEKQEIENRWMSLQIKQDITVKTLIEYGGAALFVLFLIIVWNIRLRSEIKQRKKIAVALYESEQKFRRLIELAPLPLCFVNTHKEIEYVNKCFTDVFGYTLQEIPTLKEWWLLLYPNAEYRQWGSLTWNAAVEKSIVEGKSIESIEHNLTCKDGSVRVMIVSGIVFTEGHLTMFIDITERKAAEETIRQLAFYDPLTQLPNRRLLQERLKHGIEVSHRTGNLMAVLMLDLDEFKTVNDTFGHAAGDELLQQVAGRIKVHLREMDTVARLGGDEFIVLLENVTQYEQIAHVANNLILALKQPFSLSQNYEAHIGTSIGIALYPQHGNTIETLMDNADTALYRAKDQGRGCFVYFADST